MADPIIYKYLYALAIYLETNKWTLRSLQIINLKEFMDGLIELVSLLRLYAKS